LDYGFNEKRDVSRPEWDEVFNCGVTDAGTDGTNWSTNTASCKCQGTIHFGLARAPDTGKDLNTLEKMREWKSWTKKSEGKQYVECTGIGMGVDQAEMGNTEKQCFCEPKPQPVPAKCADYGGWCRCNGLVF
jgi:hypothetical protein